MPAPVNSVLDNALGIHSQALRFRSARSEVLASNLTNADTPNFKARDLDFREVMNAQSSSDLMLKTTHRRHLNVGSGVQGGELLYRNPYQPSVDGNTVEADVEQANFARNAVQYQASLMFLTGKFRGLRDAITGGQ